MIFKLALRYFFTKNKDRTISIISYFSFIGIALGVAALIVVMGIMRGFREELIKNIIGLNSHIVISNIEKEFDIEQINKFEFIDYYMQTSSSEALLIAKNHKQGILTKGINFDDFKRKFHNIKCINNDSDIYLDKDDIAISKALGDSLNLELGDTIKLIAPSSNASIIGNIPKTKTFSINCTFESNLYEYDMKLVFINNKTAEYLFNKNQDLEIYLKKPEETNYAIQKLNIIVNNHNIISWQDQNESLLRALEIEKMSMFSILFLLIVVSGFNIISSLTILVKDKLKDIAILKTIGMSNFNIMLIFFINGIFIGFVGIMFGIILGLGIGYNLQNIKNFLESITLTKIFDPVVYFLYHLPCEIAIKDIFYISILSILLCILAAIYPSYRASKINIIDTIKH